MTVVPLTPQHPAEQLLSSWRSASAVPADRSREVERVRCNHAVDLSSDYSQPALLYSPLIGERLGLKLSSPQTTATKKGNMRRRTRQTEGCCIAFGTALTPSPRAEPTQIQAPIEEDFEHVVR